MRRKDGKPLAKALHAKPRFEVGYRSSRRAFECSYGESGRPYGVPQSRKRLIFVGVRNDIEGFPTKPPPTNFGRPASNFMAAIDGHAAKSGAITLKREYAAIAINDEMRVA